MKPAWLAEAQSAWLTVFGLPDYAAYLRHMAQRHPGRTPLTREAFAREFIDRKYGGLRSRCC